MTVGHPHSSAHGSTAVHGLQPTVDPLGSFEPPVQPILLGSDDSDVDSLHPSADGSADHRQRDTISQSVRATVLRTFADTVPDYKATEPPAVQPSLSHKSAGTLRARSQPGALHFSPDLSSVVQEAEKKWFLGRTTASKAAKLPPAETFRPPVRLADPYGLFPQYSAFPPAESDLFKGTDRSIAVSASAYKRIESESTEILKGVSTVRSVLDSATALIGHAPNPARPDSFVFNEESEPGQVGVLLAVLNDAVSNISDLAVDKRFRLASQFRTHVLDSTGGLLESEKASLLASPVQSASLFSTGSVSTVVEAKRQRERDTLSQQVMEHLAKRPKLSKPAPPNPTVNRAPQPNKGGRRGLSRGASKAARGSRSNQPRTQSRGGRPGSQQPFP